MTYTFPIPAASFTSHPPMLIPPRVLSSAEHFIQRDDPIYSSISGSHEARFQALPPSIILSPWSGFYPDQWSTITYSSIQYLIPIETYTSSPSILTHAPLLMELEGLLLLGPHCYTIAGSSLICGPRFDTACRLSSPHSTPIH